MRWPGSKAYDSRWRRAFYVLTWSWLITSVLLGAASADSAAFGASAAVYAIAILGVRQWIATDLRHKSGGVPRPRHDGRADEN